MNTRKTRKQLEAERFVKNFIQENEIAPTYDEVAQAFNISKTAAYNRLRWYRDSMRQQVFLN